MTTLLLSAGQATRLGDAAPGGCKALVDVGGRTMLDWWQEIDPGLTLVCRPEHAHMVLSKASDVVLSNGGGSAVAVQDALQYGLDSPVTVAFADTWVPAHAVPAGVDWCGVAAAPGGRRWDVLEGGLLAYVDLDPGASALVAIGLYRFADVERLVKVVDSAVTRAQRQGVEAGMADVVNLYGCSFKPVWGWQDVGDMAALAAWKDSL